MFFEAAWMASRIGAVDVAFADLDALRAMGIADTRKLETRRDLEAVRRDPRWPAWLDRAKAVAEPVHDPDAARISTDDIDRFWKAYDDARGAPDPAAIYDREYVDPASPGLQAFLALRVGTAENLAARVRQSAPYYESVRESTRRVHALEPRFRAIERRLLDLVPDATFLDVSFVIGALQSQGTSSADGLIIGAEQACRTPQSRVDGLDPGMRDLLGPFDDLEHLVAHELVHFQQHFARETSPLDQTLKEGGADLVAELISGATANESRRAYGGEAHHSGQGHAQHAEQGTSVRERGTPVLA
jgi:hypothetical protein